MIDGPPASPVLPRRAVVGATVADVVGVLLLVLWLSAVALSWGYLLVLSRIPFLVSVWQLCWLAGGVLSVWGSGRLRRYGRPHLLRAGLGVVTGGAIVGLLHLGSTPYPSWVAAPVVAIIGLCAASAALTRRVR